MPSPVLRPTKQGSNDNSHRKFDEMEHILSAINFFDSTLLCPSIHFFTLSKNAFTPNHQSEFFLNNSLHAKVKEILMPVLSQLLVLLLLLAAA